MGHYVLSGSFDMAIVVYDSKVLTLSLSFFFSFDPHHRRRADDGRPPKKKSLEVVQVAKLHKDGVRVMTKISDDTVWSGSMQRDRSVCVWELSQNFSNDFV